MSDLGLQGLEPFPHGLQIMPEPDASNACRGDRQGSFPEFVRHAELAPGGLVEGHLHDGLFHIGSDAILQERLLPGDLLQRGFAARVVEFLETVEAIPAVAHHLAGLRDIAQVFRQFQHTHLGLDDLLFHRHGPHPFREGKDSTGLSD